MVNFLNKLLITLKYLTCLAFSLFIFLLPLGTYVVHAPVNKIPSYLATSDKSELFGEQESLVVSRVVSSQERIRILLLGTDERKDEPSRSDTIILATYFPNEGKMNLLSIPRDTKVWIPGEEKPDKINSAHALGGMELIKETVEDWSGLEIDHVAKVNFNGFTELVDTVGGVTVSPERSFEYGGDSFSIGNQELDGKEALNYVRFRKDQDGDFGRIKRQQEVIENTLKAVLSDFSPSAVPSYLKFYQQYVETDMSFFDMYDVATRAFANGISIEGKTLPTSSAKIDGIWFEEANPSSTYETLAWLEKQPDEVVTKIQEQGLLHASEPKPRTTGLQDIQ